MHNMRIRLVRQYASAHLPIDAFPHKLDGMEMKDRIRALRGKKTQIQFADLLGVHQSTVHRWEHGSEPSRDELIALAGHAGMSVEEFVASDDAPPAGLPRPTSNVRPGPPISLPFHYEMPRDLPIRGTAACSSGDGAFQFETTSGYGTAVDWARRPPVLANVPDAYALYMSGDSMEPKYEHGDLVMVHPTRPVKPGDICIVVMKDGPDEPEYAYCKRFLRRHAGVVTVEQFNPRMTRDFPADRVVTLHRVLEFSDVFGGA